MNARHVGRTPRVPGIVPRRAKEEQPLIARAPYRRSMLPRIAGSLAGPQGATWGLARCLAPHRTLLPVAQCDSAESLEHDCCDQTKADAVPNIAFERAGAVKSPNSAESELPLG
jgi:hypothetical protein